MKKSEMSFMEGFTTTRAQNNNLQKAFNWDEAALIIKEAFLQHPDLIAEAGLQGDWDYTGGVIFENGKPTNDNYTYLSSNWATPTLILSWDGEEQVERECFIINGRFNADSKWDSISLDLLEIELNEE